MRDRRTLKAGRIKQRIGEIAATQRRTLQIDARELQPRETSVAEFDARHRPAFERGQIESKQNFAGGFVLDLEHEATSKNGAMSGLLAKAKGVASMGSMRRSIANLAAKSKIQHRAPG